MTSDISNSGSNSIPNINGISGEASRLEPDRSEEKLKKLIRAAIVI